MLELVEQGEDEVKEGWDELSVAEDVVDLSGATVLGEREKLKDERCRASPGRVGFWCGVVSAVLIMVWAWWTNRASPAAGAAATTAVCVAWWVTEAVPLAVTGLAPAALMPVFGGAPGKVVANAYFSDPIMLFFGSALVATAVERHGLHARLARRLAGWASSDAGLVAATIAATAACSAFMSNTTTSAMMSPLAKTVSRDKPRRVKVATALAVCYGAACGGMSTLTGTGVNLAYQAVAGATFAGWFAKAAPIAACAGIGLWVLLRVYFRLSAHAVVNLPTPAASAFEAVASSLEAADDDETEETEEPSDADARPRRRPEHHRRNENDDDDDDGGRDDDPVQPRGWTRAQTVVVVDATAMVALWLTRDGAAVGGGWSSWLRPGYATDGTVAVAAALCLLVAPGDVLPWKDAVAAFPWDAFFLLAGGVALAVGINDSGLDALLATHVLSKLHHRIRTLVAVLAAVALSNFVSNVAAANIFLPLLAAGGGDNDDDNDRTLLLVALSCSFAFLFPISTPPNAIVFAAVDDLNTATMLKVGAIFTLICLGLLALATFLYL